MKLEVMVDVDQLDGSNEYKYPHECFCDQSIWLDWYRAYSDVAP